MSIWGTIKFKDRQCCNRDERISDIFFSRMAFRQGEDQRHLSNPHKVLTFQLKAKTDARVGA